MKKLLLLSLFLFLILFSSPSMSQSNNVITANINLGNRNQPLIWEQEISINEFNTAFIKNTYHVKYGIPNFSCNTAFTFPRPTATWDYKVFWNGELNYSEPYLESKLNQSSGIYETTLPKCGTFSSPSEVVQEYYFSNYSDNQISKNLYPFDSYLINSSWNVGNDPTIFFSKVFLPKNTVPIGYNVLSGPFADPKVLFAEFSNGTKVFVGDVDFYFILYRPAQTALIDDNIVLIYPQFAIPTKSQLEKYVNATNSYLIEDFRNRPVNIIVNWGRPPFVIAIWIFSLLTIIILTIAFLRKNLDFNKYLLDCFLVFGFQEGVNQLVPSNRPLEITLFEITIIIPLIVLSLYFLTRLLTNRRIFLNMRKWRELDTQTQFRISMGITVTVIGLTLMLFGIDRIAPPDVPVAWLYFGVGIVSIIIGGLVVRSALKSNKTQTIEEKVDKQIIDSKEKPSETTM